MKKYGEKRKMNVIFYKNCVIFVELCNICGKIA